MEFESILKSISNYSLSIVLSATLIYILIKSVNLGFSLLSTRIGNKKHDKLLDMRQEIDEQVYHLLNDFLDVHKGYRIQLVEFTNSVQSVAYLPFKYMSCTYEVFTYGRKPCAKIIDKLSTSLFSQFLAPLSRNGTAILDLSSDDLQCGAVHDLYNTIGDEKVLFAVLKSAKGKSIGYVSLSKEAGFSTFDISAIKSLASQLYALLGVLDN